MNFINMCCNRNGTLHCAEDLGGKRERSGFSQMMLQLLYGLCGRLGNSKLPTWRNIVLPSITKCLEHYTDVL